MVTRCRLPQPRPRLLVTMARRSLCLVVAAVACACFAASAGQVDATFPPQSLPYCNLNPTPIPALSASSKALNPKLELVNVGTGCERRPVNLFSLCCSAGGAGVVVFEASSPHRGRQLLGSHLRADHPPSAHRCSCATATARCRLRARAGPMTRPCGRAS